MKGGDDRWGEHWFSGYSKWRERERERERERNKEKRRTIYGVKQGERKSTKGGERGSKGKEGKLIKVWVITQTTQLHDPRQRGAFDSTGGGEGGRKEGEEGEKEEERGKRRKINRWDIPAIYLLYSLDRLAPPPHSSVTISSLRLLPSPTVYQ